MCDEEVIDYFKVIWMSCLFCVEYRGLKEPCTKGITIENLSESFDCEFYKYNGRVKYEQGQ
jgi:hypothetical protein